MEINKAFFHKIRPILLELKKKLKTDFVVFGSAPLYLLKVLDFDKTAFNDIDVAVRDEKTIPKEVNIVYFHDNPKQKFYKISINNVNVDIGYPWPGHKKIFNKIFGNPIIIDGIKFANLDVIQEWKELMIKEYNRQKDKNHLEKIAAFRENQNK